jgi:hypothetical protein
MLIEVDRRRFEVLDGAEQVDQVRPPRPIADVERAVQALLSMASSLVLAFCSR